MPPLNSPQAKERVERLVRAGVDAGASLPLDGIGQPVEGYPDGNWVGPTILSDVTPDMECYRNEIFGPVLQVRSLSLHPSSAPTPPGCHAVLPRATTPASSEPPRPAARPPAVAPGPFPRRLRCCTPTRSTTRFGSLTPTRTATAPPSSRALTHTDRFSTARPL